MKIKSTDVVAEYLHEVDLRLTGLPVLQRRELLADLAAHIETERTERHIETEGELIEVLERLGSPDVVAAAAYEEVGLRPQPPVAPPKRRSWIPIALIIGAVVVLLALCGVLFFAQSSRADRPEPAQPVPASAQHQVGP
jgi:uncharacterized membrane protein